MRLRGCESGVGPSLGSFAFLGGDEAGGGGPLGNRHQYVKSEPGRRAQKGYTGTTRDEIRLLTVRLGLRILALMPEADRRFPTWRLVSV